MILCGPGFQGGSVPRNLVSLIDLPPTILTAAGLRPPETHRGRPLQPLPAGGDPDWPGEVFLQISESQCGRAMRTERWKYSVRAPGAPGDQPASDLYEEDCLYDLAADPHERDNRVSDPALADIRAQLAQALIRRMKAAGEAAPRIRPSPAGGGSP